LDYVVAGAIGFLVGSGELIARYRDAPLRALRNWNAAVYVGFNLLASVSALALIHVFGWTFGASTDGDQLRWTQVLVAGFGAMALFRTSLFIVRAGDQDIGIGPVSFLQVILGASDRGVDRLLATQRAPMIAEIMDGLKFDEIRESLPAVAAALMQNLSPEDQAELGNQVKGLAGSAMPERAKVLNLGALLMNFVGEDVLRAAVTTLRQSLAATADVKTGEAPPA
jgi:hypothetical protein